MKRPVFGTPDVTGHIYVKHVKYCLKKKEGEEEENRCNTKSKGVEY